MKVININVKEEIYEKFKKICRDNDSSAAVEIRRFMKKEVEKNEKEK